MGAQVGRMVRDRVAAARTVLGQRDLRRLTVSYAVVQLGSWAGFVAVSLFAFRQGGAREVGVMTAVRLAPTVIASPFAGLLADRLRRKLVIAGVAAIRTCTQLAAALLVLEHGAAGAVFAVVALAAVAETALDPARAALLPALARTPEQLTAANALDATVDGGALMLGPALGGVLLAAFSIQLVLALDGTAAALAAMLALTIAEPSRPRQKLEPHGIVRESLAGFGAILGDRTLRVVVGLFAAQMLAFGLLLVFIVAVPLQELHAGARGLGWLNAAAGIGAIGGGVLTMTLKGGRLAPPLLAGMALIALGYATLAAIANLAAAIAGLLVMNLGACYVDVATFTLLQRAVDEDLLARAFSVIGTVVFAALLCGGVLAPALISALGLRAALGVTAAGALGSIALAYPALRRIDASAPGAAERVALLGAVPMFEMLPVPVLERLAAATREGRAEPGEEIVRQGEPGDAYYVLAEGQVEVLVDGISVSRLGPGTGFGEIALLADRPRTATVRALEQARFERLDREAFLEVVAGNAESHAAGQSISRVLLTRASPGLIA